MKNILFSFLISFSSSLALADQMGPNGDRFYEETAHYMSSCDNRVCKAPFKQQVVYDISHKVNKLSAKNLKMLTEVALDQSSIWGDTILEGDYVSDGKTKLVHVVAYAKNEKVIGYRMIYAEKAWDTSTCNYDSEREETLKGCKRGRIEEETFASADGQTYFTNEEALATFLDLQLPAM